MCETKEIDLPFQSNKSKFTQVFSTTVIFNGFELLVEHKINESHVKITNRQTGKEHYIVLSSLVNTQDKFDIWVEGFFAGQYTNI